MVEGKTMAVQWYVKELAKLAGVSVQTLHYYDRNNVLKPSIRLSNGYRLYSQADLLKLQQVVALKFFGFGLADIKRMLSGDVDVHQHLKGQVAFLEQRAKTLAEAAETLKKIATAESSDTSVPWETVIKMIEVYRMMEQFEKTWLGEIFTKDQLERVVRGFGSMSEKDRQAYANEWDLLVDEVGNHLGEDPSGAIGQKYAHQWMALVTRYSSPADRDLGEAVWKAYKGGNVPLSEEARAGYPCIPREMVLWIDKAAQFMFKNEVMQRFENSWLGNVLTSQQLKKLMTSFGRVPEVDRRAYSQKWDALIPEVALHLHEDPCGPVGQKYLKQWHELEYTYVLDQDIQDAIWDAYKRGAVPKNSEERMGYPDISQEMVTWLERAAHITCNCKKKK
jgi:DNA-binding transcriptional MerR regulator